MCLEERTATGSVAADQKLGFPQTNIGGEFVEATLSWSGLSAPKAITDKLKTAAIKAMRSPAIHARMAGPLW
jgi:hypothetical protein